MSISELNTLYTEAVAAIDAADYDLAIRKLMAVKARLATTPNITRALAGSGSQGISWAPAQIDSLIAQCRQLKAAARAATSGPFQQTKVVYRRPDNADSYT
jgi:hypothetical protein